MKTQLFKALLCLTLVFMIVLPLTGCENNAPTNHGEQTVAIEGTAGEDKIVTLDTFAMREYQMKFDELSQSAERQRVIILYLESQLPAMGKKQKDGKEALIAQLASLDVASCNIPNAGEKGVDLAGNLLSDAATALSLADLYAKSENNIEFEIFVETLNKSCKLLDVTQKFAKACFIVTDLANNDISNKQEYCDDAIDALSFITSNVPVFGEYFSEYLGVVKQGLRLVLTNVESHKAHMAACGAEIGGSTFFSRKNFEKILKPNEWDDSHAPTIADILKRAEDFDTIPKGEPFDYLRKYILYRVSHKPTESPTVEPSASTEAVQNGCTHDKVQGETISDATCEKEGVYKDTCEQCGITWEWKINATGHAYDSAVTTEATCTQKGVKTYTCKRCDDAYTEDIAKLDHVYDSAVTTEATNTQDGVKTYTCEHCGDKYTEVIEKLDQAYDSETTTEPSIPTEDTEPPETTAPTQSTSPTEDTQPATEETVPEATMPQVFPAVWSGNGTVAYSFHRYFELTVSEMNETYISGYLVVDGGTSIINVASTGFTGTGKIMGNTIIYTITFDTPVEVGVIPVFEYEQTELYYEKGANTFSFDFQYRVTMEYMG